MMDFTGLKIPDLDGKAVLITGASTGIGAACAKAFAAQGCKVAIHYNSSAEAAKKVEAEIEAAGGTAALVKADFSVSAEVRRAAVEGRLGAHRFPVLFTRLDHRSFRHCTASWSCTDVLSLSLARCSRVSTAPCFNPMCSAISFVL